MAVAAHIRMLLPALSQGEQNVATWLLERGNLTNNPKIGEVAAALGISEAMVVKVARRLGYSGFKDLRADLLAYYSHLKVELDEDLSRDDSVAQIVRKVFAAERSALEEVESILDINAIGEAARIFMRAKHRDLYGVGGSATVCADASHKFLRIGIRSSVFSDAHLIAMSASLLEKDDAVLAVSHSGESKDVILGAEVAHAAGAKVITITNSIASTLARNSDVVLCAPAKEAPLMGQNAAARIAQLAILDTMFICLAREDYQTAEKNLNKVMSSVAVYSTTDRGRTDRRGTPRAEKSSPDGVQPAKETARKRVEP
jgi:DNA-binding MurR/RpiR family transcriptional regulator